MRNALAILLLIFFTSCENEYDFPLASKDLTVGPLYSYISNPILKVGDNDTDFDNKAISSPTVVAVENKLIMYYTALSLIHI
ncbi:MAG: hypothetical protein N2746_06385, partial [Deltaproteobacteria bacterium]|nr:hypothetical protein [Deltaproteobacteria bacterium]